MLLKVHEAFGRELRTFGMARQRMLAAEDMSSLEQRQRGEAGIGVGIDV